MQEKENKVLVITALCTTAIKNHAGIDKNTL